MLKNLKRNFFVFSTYLLSLPTFATTIQWEGGLDKNVQKYLDLYQDFRYQVCRPNTEEKFNSLLKRYRGQGYWIPEVNGDVDVEALEFILPELKKKLTWIKEQKKKITHLKNIPSGQLIELKKTYQRLMLLKNSEIQNDEKEKINSRQESLKLISQIQNQFDTLIQKFSFFSNYNFPVDHLKNRKFYDMLKDREDIDSKKISNKAFLKRKIQEDGTYLKDHTSSDIYFRTTLDTLFFELKEHDFYLSENARYDLEFILDKMESEIKKGKNIVLERLNEWEERTQKTFNFYESLTLKENTKEVIVSGVKISPNKLLIKEKNLASDALKDFVYKKQAEVYKYWLSKSELEKAIFVIETILMNEVGSVDGDDALERMDVARVVLNRYHRPKYLDMSSKEFIFPYIHSLTQDSKIKSEKWLNILFKQGEFSFTYYYMLGASKIFCPDNNRDAKKLRKQNIEIALLALKEGKTSFQTTRYFSRASMIGRIHMDSIWEDYVPFPERPGLLVKGQDDLMKSFLKGDFTFLYAFKDPENRDFQVLKIKGKNYVLGRVNGVNLFYHHRNPHHFRYFTKLEASTN